MKKTQQVKVFDRASMRMIADHMTELLKAEAAKFGLDCERVAGRGDPSAFDFKCKFLVRGSDGSSGAQMQWEKYAPYFGLKKEWFGREFWATGGFYKIVGISDKRIKYPVLAENAAGKRYKFSVTAVKLAMKEEEA